MDGKWTEVKLKDGNTGYFYAPYVPKWVYPRDIWDNIVTSELDEEIVMSVKEVNNEMLKKMQQELMGLYNIPVSKSEQEGIDHCAKLMSDQIDREIVEEVIKKSRRDTDRTHEECADCSLEWVYPPQCKGHASGPVTCSMFKQKVKNGK